MKIIFIFLITLLGVNYAFAQSAKPLSEDEKARIKASIILITYDTVGTFDNAAGEAYYCLVIASFKEDLIIPQFTSSSLTPNDKNKVEKLIQLLNHQKQNPPTWDDLLVRQTQYLLWLDKVSHKKSKYKTENSNPK